MEKTALGLIAALGAATVAPAAQAAVAPAERLLNPASIAELLEPVADPVATLSALDAQRQLEGVEPGDREQTAEMLVVRRHHHHHFWRRHHHHHFWRRFHHHHHHHHMF